MKEKEEIQELELEVEKALDEIFKGAKKTELREEEIETYTLLEPVAEGEEALKKDLEELVGEILTLEWEIIPEIGEKALQKCQKLKAQPLDSTNRELISLLEIYLKEIRNLDALTPQKLDHLKQLGNIIYAYNFEGKDIKKELAEFKARVEKEREAEKEAAPEVTPKVEELSLELEEPVVKEEPVIPKEPEAPPVLETLEELKPPEKEPSPLEKRPSPGEVPEELIRQLLKDYQRMIAIEELLSFNKIKAIRKLLLKSRKEIEETLLPIRPDIKRELEIREREIRKFLRQKEEKLKVDIKEGLLCRTATRTILIPIEEVAFAGDIEEFWKPYLHEGFFPLKLLRGKGFWNRWFGKIKPKLQGELAEKEENELKEIKLKTNKLLTTETKLVIAWKEGKGLAILCQDFKLISVDPQIHWIPEREPMIARALIDDEEVYLFSVTKWVC